MSVDEIEIEEICEDEFYEVIGDLWHPTRKNEHINLYALFGNVCRMLGNLMNVYEERRKIKGKKSLFQQIADNERFPYPRNFNSMMSCLRRIFYAYMYICKQNVDKLGKVYNPITKHSAGIDIYNLFEGSLYKFKKSNAQDRIKGIMEEAKEYGVKDLANGDFGVVFGNMYDIVNSAHEPTDIYRIHKNRFDNWAINKDINIISEYGDMWRVPKGIDNLEEFDEWQEKHKEKAFIEKVEKAPIKPISEERKKELRIKTLKRQTEKTIKKRKAAKQSEIKESNENKTDFKQNEILTMSSKLYKPRYSDEQDDRRELFKYLIEESVKGPNKILKDDFSNFDEYIKMMLEDLENIYEKQGIDAAFDEDRNYFLEAIADYLAEELEKDETNLTLKKAKKCRDTLMRYVDKEKYIKSLNNQINYLEIMGFSDEDDNEDIDEVKEEKVAIVEEKPTPSINAMNDIDAAKTEPTGATKTTTIELKKTGKSRRRPQPKPQKELVKKEPIKRLRGRAPVGIPSEFAEWLAKKQHRRELLRQEFKHAIEQQIDGHNVKFEVSPMEPTKSTITFNKAGDTAIIKPSFKAKITFP